MTLLSTKPRNVRYARSVSTAIGVVAFTASLATSATAREQLRVRADSEIVNVGLVRGASSIEVSGGLRDDVGHAVPAADVVVPLPRRSAPGGGALAAPCRAGDIVHETGGEVTARTDAVGFFCVRLPNTDGVEGLVLRYTGDRYHAAASAPIPRETGQRRLRLDFEPGSQSVSLDASSFLVRVTTQVVEGVGMGDPLRLVLFHRPEVDRDQEVELGATDVQVGSPAKFDIETRALGGPGTGQLIVRFAGTGQLAPASETALIERHATARLSLAVAPPPSDPSDGVELSVGASSAIGAVTEGWVEALVEGQPVGLAPVAAGAARVVAAFAAPRGRPAQVTLRYVPADSGFIPAEPIVVDIPIRPANPLSGTPWLLGAAAIAYWVVRAWRRPARRARAIIAEGGAPPSGRAAVEVLEQDPARTGWRGRVVDAHDGTPIAGARVSIVVPVFDGEGVAAAQNAAEDGAFALPHVAAARNEGARLVVTARYHATLSEKAPPDGVVAVRLVSRRRALIERLVAWAGRAGRPWAQTPEPTPLELAQVARRRRHALVADWASAVADAAYGREPPDERREAEIVAQEPPISGLSD